MIFLLDDIRLKLFLVRQYLLRENSRQLRNSQKPIDTHLSCHRAIQRDESEKITPKNNADLYSQLRIQA